MVASRGSSLSLVAMESLSANKSRNNPAVKIRIAAFVACCLVMSCSFQEEQKNPPKQNYYLVQELNEILDEDAATAPPMGYYAKHNILLIDSTKELFYHDKYFSCGTGFSPGDPPMPIDLTSGELLKFSTIEEVIDRIEKSESTPRLVIIGSDVDTIRGKQYFELVRALSEIDKCYLLNTRRLTEDERTGLALTH